MTSATQATPRGPLGGTEDGAQRQDGHREPQMRLKHELRHIVQRFGIDIVRYPLHDPMARVVQLLNHHRIGCVVDVGANDGGYATTIRGLGYTDRIISFEPLQRPFEALRRKAAGDPNWDVVQRAVGDTQTEVTINVAGNDGLSSSVLPMLESHTAVAPSRDTWARKLSNRTVSMSSCLRWG